MITSYGIGKGVWRRRRMRRSMVASSLKVGIIIDSFMEDYTTSTHARTRDLRYNRIDVHAWRSLNPLNEVVSQRLVRAGDALFRLGPLRPAAGVATPSIQPAHEVDLDDRHRALHGPAH